MKREFKFDEKETYSATEVKELLSQHSTFVESGFKGYVAKEDHEKVLDELKPYKQEKRTSHIKSLVGDLTSQDKLKGALALAGISDDDDDDAIKSKVQKTLEENPYLQKVAGTPGEVIETKPKPKAEAKKEYKFVRPPQS